MPETALATRISINAEDWRERFAQANPFRHVVIDNFFEPAFAQRLLAEFPAFNPALAKNEIYGGVWGKAVNTRLREIAPAYRELYDLIASPEFLATIGEISGITGLMFDPAFYGGGTHENLHGQDLDPHVDFNYDQAQQLHRRLNLIVYLNKDWRAEWGGALELHSNPRRPEENRIRSIDPLFNRAVLFETNEHSWHGFPRIVLPEAERGRSRKSISIYLYTRERPAEEIAPLHGTFYVQRPLPVWVRPGHVLSEEDCAYLAHAADRRDKWIESYQRMELEKSGQLAQHDAYIRDLLRRVRVPSTGYVQQEGDCSGVFGDGWAAPKVTFRLRPLQPVTAVTVYGWRPESAPAKIALRVNGGRAAEITAASGTFELASSGPPLTDPFDVEIESEWSFRPDGDDRDLSFVLTEVRASH